MKRPGTAWAVLTFLALWLAPLGAQAQANRTNPFIWQIMVEYDIGRSNQSANYINDSSAKLYSQDFQTVFSHNDLYGDNERLLLDFGDSCPGTVIDTIQSLNGNTATNPSMMSQPSIALIQRSGGCELWSDKISTTQALSESYKLNIGAVLIYDNVSSSATEIIRESPSNSSYPTWKTPLPSERDVNHMTDNNVAQSLGNIFVAVYFVPNTYGLALKDMIRNYTSAPSDTMKQRYIQLAMYFEETTIATSDSNAPNPDSGSGSRWSIFAADNAYIGYLVAAGVLFLLLLILLRWFSCTRRRNRDNALSEAETGVVLPVIARENKNKLHKMSLVKLNDMCPVQTWQANAKNSVCAICLEELKELDNVRVLPCDHGFCVACIDVWLTKKSALCPICKYDCDPVVEDNAPTPSEPQDDASAVQADQVQLEHTRTAPATITEASPSNPEKPRGEPQRQADSPTPHNEASSSTAGGGRQDEGQEEKAQETHPASPVCVDEVPNRQNIYQRAEEETGSAESRPAPSKP